MASNSLLQLTNPAFQSPAKIFAQLKSKVQKEAVSSKEATFTVDDPLRNLREHRGVHSAPNASCAWTAQKLREDKRLFCYPSEVQPLTFPLSPQKACDDFCSTIGNKPSEEMLPDSDTFLAPARREGSFLESTAVARDFLLPSRAQSLRESSRVGLPCRTPVKTRQTEAEFADRDAPLQPAFLSCLYSPIKNRLRKRKLDYQGSRKDCGSSVESDGDTSRPPQQRKKPALSRHEPVQNLKRVPDCLPSLEKVSIMSPAKTFAYMKQRECKNDQEFQKGSRRAACEWDDKNSPDPCCVEQNAGKKLQVVSRNPQREVAGGSPSRAHSFEDAPASLPVLPEDPLILNSPRIAIPKRDKALFSSKPWPNQENFPADSVITLRKWFLRRSKKGLFVDGIHGTDNIPWSTNIILERISKSALKTVSGSVYVLVGKMNTSLASDFPKWFLKQFVYGFPSNWKKLYEKFLSQMKKERAGRSEDRDTTQKTIPEKTSVSQSSKKRLQAVKMSESCSEPCSRVKTSRSGRTIKAPLEYWKGGRVILDADMNVTIHECYDKSSMIISPKEAEKSTHVFLPGSKSRKQNDSVSNVSSVPVRRLNSQRARAGKKPAEPSETLKNPKEQLRTMRSSSLRHPAPKRGTCLESAPHKQSEPEIRSTRRSKEWADDTESTLPRAKRTLQKGLRSPEISFSSSDAEVSRSTNKQEKDAQNRKVTTVYQKSQQNNSMSVNRPTESTKKGRKGRGTKVDETKTKTVPLTHLDLKHPSKKPLANKRPQKKGEDEWTEAELKRLQEAVNYYPKHVAGYWAKVASMVGTRSSEECHKRSTSQGTSHTTEKNAKNHKSKKVQAAEPSECPVVSARAGTLKRKQQVRQFLETLPREDVVDAFSSAYMQNKCFEIPSLCSSEDRDFALSDLEPQTPMSSCFPKSKTPQCSNITPGMMGSPNTNNDDKYVYQLQKRTKKSQFNVLRKSPSSKQFSPSPSAKQRMRRCPDMENDMFAVWEMFPGKEGAISESGEEEDFYFSDD